MARVLSSLFGNFNVNEIGDIDQLPITYNDSTKDFVFRESGLQKKTSNLDRALNALANPETYLREKRQNIVDIGDTLNQYFQKKYLAYIQRDYTDIEARKMAWKDTKEKQTVLMDDHNRMYPTSIKDNSSGLQIAATKKQEGF